MGKKIVKIIAIVLSMMWIALIAREFGYKAIIASLALLGTFIVYMNIEREEEDKQLVEDVLNAILDSAADDEE